MRSYLERRGISDLENGSSRLLVCINDNEDANRLVRAGRRMADETRSEWTVMHVETPDQMDGTGRGASQLAEHMRLAELLGATTETITGRSVAEAVQEYARLHHIRRIMVGRSYRARWQRLLNASLAETLLRSNPTISVHVVGSDHMPQAFQMPPFWKWITRMQLLGSVAGAVLPTLLGMALWPTIISRSANLVMLYLLSVVIASVFLGFIPALLTAVLSVLAFDFFFIPPLFRVFDYAPEYAITFIRPAGDQYYHQHAGFARTISYSGSSPPRRSGHAVVRIQPRPLRGSGYGRNPAHDPRKHSTYL